MPITLRPQAYFSTNGRQPSRRSRNSWVSPNFSSGWLSQIADRADLLFVRPSLPHDQGISIVESELVRHAHAELRELLTHFVLRCRGTLLENFFRDRSGVFRIERDLVAAQRLPENDCAAHSLAMFGRKRRPFASARFAISARTYDSVNFFEPNQDRLGFTAWASKPIAIGPMRPIRPIVFMRARHSFAR